MRIAPLGPEAIQARIRQIEDRMAELFGRFPYVRSEPPLVHSESFASRSFQPLSGAIASGPLPEWAIPVDSTLSPLVPTEIMPSNAGVGPEELQKMADDVADEFRIDKALFRALIGVESRWNPNAVSPTGEQGLAQLKPDVARELGVIDTFDPEQSLRAGARYLRQMLSEFDSLEAAVAAYKVGPGAVRRYGGLPPFIETNTFVRRVLSEVGQ